MRYLCLLIALGAMSVDVCADALPPAVRPLDAWAAESLARATQRSALVRELLATIASGHVVVHVETAAVMPAGLGGMTRFVSTSHGFRYLRITLLRGLEPRERATMLGHELQHASEIAESSASDQDGVRRLFEDLNGVAHSHRVSFETRAAVIAERQVSLELRSRSVPYRPSQ